MRGRLPEAAIFAVFFILYSNVAVIATRFHGVPKALASLFPLLLIIPIARHMIARRSGLIWTPALPFLLAFLGVQLIGMAFSRNFEVTRTVVVELVTEGILIYLLITNAVRTPAALRSAVWGLLIAGSLTALVPLYQQATGSFQSDFAGFGQMSETGFRTGEVARHGEVRQMRLAGPIGEQNRYAQNLLMLLPLGFFMLRDARSRGRRAAALIATGLIGAALLLTFSRGGAVALLLLLVVMAAMRLFTFRSLSAVAAAALIGLLALPEYRARLATLGDISAVFSETRTEEPDSAITGRLTEMAAAALVFADHPTIGVGPGLFKYHSAEYGNELGIRKLEGTRKAHSLYLEVAAENGTLGLIAFFGMVFVTLHALVRVRRRLLSRENRARSGIEQELGGLTAGLLLAIIAYLASALFLHLAYIRFFYAMLALAGSAAWIGRAHLEAPRPAGAAARS